MAQATPLVLEIQRMSTDDGPGIRTTVFLKGCSLACDWCHNPESISPRPVVVWFEERCMACGACLTACTHGALAAREGGALVRDRARCRGCGSCAEACPALATERLGDETTPAALAQELVKDLTYFETSGGGVTISGGEPTLFPAFTAATLDALGRLGVHTALDTCGECSEAVLSDLAARADLVLFDLKLADSAAHRRFTGKPNERIVRNLAALGEQIRRTRRPAALWVRTPLIPSRTSDIANIEGIARILEETAGDQITRWELTAFNNLCRDKYRRLANDDRSRPWALAGVPRMTAQELRACEAAARRAFSGAAEVLATGATRAGGPDGRG